VPTEHAAAFRAARVRLLTYRVDYETAYRELRWPELNGFNNDRHERAGFATSLAGRG
jgi:hypothetical protein